MTASQDSPKKSKKLRTDRDVSSKRERTRSRKRAEPPQTQVQTYKTSPPTTPRQMPYVYKLATLNIQEITSDTRIQTLKDFLHAQDIDIALLQEITVSHLNGMSRYNVYMYRGTDGRGTAILTKEGLTATNILRFPTGRSMAAEINGLW
jgi:hypothetical protein